MTDRCLPVKHPAILFFFLQLPANRSARENDFFRKAAAGETQGELEMPESTPLVFPALDNVTHSVVQSGDVEKKNAFMRCTKFAHTYYDKRAQIKYANKSQTQAIVPADQRPNFATRVADPNHPAFQGSWLTVFSGCKIKPSTADGRNGEPSGGRGKRGRKKGRKLKSGSGSSSGLYPEMVLANSLQNLLYLMIVNMPSDQELAAAKQQLEMAWVQNCPATETN